MKIIDINKNERECDRVFLDPSWPGYVTVVIPSKFDPERKRTEWIPLKDFFANNPDYKNKIENFNETPPLPPQITGVITSSQEITLTDSTQKWTPNIYAGFYCWISRGIGEGQVRTILSNTKNKLILDKIWDTKPNKTSQYTIVYIKPSVSVMNNILPGI